MLQTGPIANAAAPHHTRIKTMATRKTINVNDAVSILHNLIKTVKTAEEKQALCAAIEEMLFATNNYRGFGYTFYNLDAVQKYGSVDAAIAAGLGTEYDRQYF
jgi:hypothetical protein